MTKLFRTTNDQRHELPGDSSPVDRGRPVAKRSGARRKDAAFVIRHGLAILVAAATFGQVCAQEQVHLLHAGKLPPGAIGAQQLARGGPLAGYFQPIEIKAPAGARVSLAIDQQFSAPQPTPLKVGLLVAPVYRLRVTQIPNHDGEEVYPTIEIINRIYPPVGEEFRFPIPIELTQAELELALAGKFVTRVVYLEDPARALPVARTPQGPQEYFEVRPIDDPLEVADRLGRPVAILRLGGRLPDTSGPDARFLYGSPPVLIPNSLDLYSEPIDEPPAAVEPLTSTALPDRNNVSNTPSAVSPAAAVTNASENKPEQRPVAVAPSKTEKSRRDEKSPTVRLATGSSRRTIDERASRAVWQPNKPAPVAVSVTDDE